MWLFALCVCLASIGVVSSLHIGVVSFPELGHLNPLLSIVEQAHVEGHTADIFGPDFFMPHCKREAGAVAECISLGFVNTSAYDETFFQKLVERPALETLSIVQENVLNYNNLTAPRLLEAAKLKKYDIFLVDFGQWSGVAIADVLNVPVMLIWPLTLQFPVQTNPSVPAIGTALSANMSPLQRFGNYVFQRLSLLSGVFRQGNENVVRESVGARPVDQFDYYYRRWVVSPSILGLDVSQPLCPNVIPVGFMHRQLEKTPLPENWIDWMSNCQDGLIYFNMGSVAVVPDSWAVHFLDAIQGLTQSRMCVVWKISKKQIAAMNERIADSQIDQSLIRLSSHLPFSPRQLLATSTTKVFVTHCGDTSVYESVEAAVPMVGIPLFADQPDMCQRVNDAGIGIALDKFTFTGESLEAAIRDVIENNNAPKKLAQLRHQALSQGGVSRAVRALENAVKFNVSDFSCKHVNLTSDQFFDLDIILLTAVALLVLKQFLSFCC